MHFSSQTYHILVISTNTSKLFLIRKARPSLLLLYSLPSHALMTVDLVLVSHARPSHQEGEGLVSCNGSTCSEATLHTWMLYLLHNSRTSMNKCAQHG